MAFVLKAATTSPGVVMFTHKEARFLNSPVPSVQARLAALRERYIVGMHWGFAFDRYPHVPVVDFNLAGAEILGGLAQYGAKGIPLPSRCFISGLFRPDPGVAKYWDIMTVSHMARHKNLDQMLTVLRDVYDRRPETRVLMVVSEPEHIDPAAHYAEITDDWRRLFNDDECARLTLMRLAHSGKMYALEQEVISYFYQASRVFTLFSDIEGGPKAVSEALLTGLPIVVKDSLRGGGRELLDDNNSRQFGSLDTAADAFIDILDNYDELSRFDLEQLGDGIREEHSIPRLKQALVQAFGDRGLTGDGDWDTVNLARRLPAHTTLLPRHLAISLQDDLRSTTALLEFLHRYCDVAAAGAGTRLLAEAAEWPARAKGVVGRLVKG